MVPFTVGKGWKVIQKCSLREKEISSSVPDCEFERRLDKDTGDLLNSGDLSKKSELEIVEIS